jgi:thioredoxin-related protein
MVKFLSVLFVLIFSSFSYSTTTTIEPGKLTGGQKSTLPDWFKESFLDISEDLEEATDSGKHLLLYMHLTGCPYCYKMIEESFKNSINTEIIKSYFDVVAINVRGNNEVILREDLVVTEDEVRDHFEVRFTPTIVFLDEDNNLVYKVNGFRTPESFKYILDFIRSKSYKSMNLVSFIEQQKRPVYYATRNHESFQNITNLKDKSSDRLLVLFEDKYCELCDQLYDGHLKNPEILDLLKKYTVVRLDTGSEETFVDVDGSISTADEFAKKLGLNYRPGMVMFDKGKEVLRIDSMIYSYHFAGHLRYVADRHYEKYPESVYEYLRVYREEVLKSGKDIDLSK